MWGRVEYNIIVCCDTIRDRDDIGWFVVYCIQQSQSNIGALYTAITEKCELVMACGVLHTAITERYRCIAYSNHRKI